MSESVIEVANREADEAERDIAEQMTPDIEPDTEPDTEPEPDVEPDTEPGVEPNLPSDAAAERALKQIDKAGDAYTKKVQTIQQATPLGLVECPLCPIPGFVLDGAPAEASDDQIAAVLSVLGLTGPASYPQSPQHSTCPTCEGGGFLATGSKREGKKDIDCPECMGNGYRNAVYEAELGTLRSAEGQLTVPPSVAVDPSVNGSTGYVPITQGGHTFTLVPGGAPDQIGRLAGHPLWGMPAERGGI